MGPAEADLRAEGGSNIGCVAWIYTEDRFVKPLALLNVLLVLVIRISATKLTRELAVVEAPPMQKLVPDFAKAAPLVCGSLIDLMRFLWPKQTTQILTSLFSILIDHGRLELLEVVENSSAADL